MSGQTNLLTSWEEVREEPTDDGVVFVKLTAGEGHTRAIFEAVADRYHEFAQRSRPTEADFERFLDQKVTLVTQGENFIGGGIIAAQEGKLVRPSDGGFGIIPKGARTKGFRVRPEKVLDFFSGYVTEYAMACVAEVRSRFPMVRQLTQARLEQLPAESSTLSLCMFGTYRMPHDAQTDALYLASNYWPGDDIIEGVVLLRPSVGVSEHGSAYGRQFVGGTFGEVVDFQPISFAEGIELCNLDFDDAFERVVDGKVPA